MKPPEWPITPCKIVLLFFRCKKWGFPLRLAYYPRLLCHDPAAPENDLPSVQLSLSLFVVCVPLDNIRPNVTHAHTHTRTHTKRNLFSNLFFYLHLSGMQPRTSGLGAEVWVGGWVGLGRGVGVGVGLVSLVNLAFMVFVLDHI